MGEAEGGIERRSCGLGAEVPLVARWLLPATPTTVAERSGEDRKQRRREKEKRKKKYILKDSDKGTDILGG